ncbi:MAG: hypothetical protein Q9168_004348 [Polycauliona sp. 1 TL-2023]
MVNRLRDLFVPCRRMGGIPDRLLAMQKSTECGICHQVAPRRFTYGGSVRLYEWDLVCKHSCLSGAPGTKLSIDKSRWGYEDGFHASKSFAFTLGPLCETSTYNLTEEITCPEPPNLEAARIPMVTDPTERDDAHLKFQASELAFLELYNEPDFRFLDFTPLTSAKDAAFQLKPLIEMDSSTTLISPVPAWTGQHWLEEFSGNCTGCMDKIGIVAAHIYSVESQGAVDQIKMLHDRWPDKKLWITELSPSTG